MRPGAAAYNEVAPPSHYRVRSESAWGPDTFTVEANVTLVADFRKSQADRVLE